MDIFGSATILPPIVFLWLMIITSKNGGSLTRWSHSWMRVACFVGVGKENESLFSALTSLSVWSRTWYISGLSTLYDILLDCCSLFGFCKEIWVASWECSMTTLRNCFCSIGRWRLPFFPPHCLCSVIIHYCPFDGFQIIPGKRLVIILISATLALGTDLVLVFDTVLSNHNPDFLKYECQ